MSAGGWERRSVANGSHARGPTAAGCAMSLGGCVGLERDIGAIVAQLGAEVYGGGLLGGIRGGAACRAARVFARSGYHLISGVYLIFNPIIVG